MGFDDYGEEMGELRGCLFLNLEVESVSFHY